MELGKKRALIKTAKLIHDLSNNDKNIPVYTGYLSTESPVFKSQNDNAIISYETDYAQYVWEKNVTGVPHWSFKTFETHKKQILHEFFEDMMKGTQGG